MKLRVIDRLLIALSGLILLALAVWLALDATSLVVPISEVLAWLLNAGRMQMVWLIAGVCAILALLGLYEISMLFRKRVRHGFITQKSENGEIAISVKSIESLAIKCAQKHGEISVQSVSVEEARDGLIIRLRTTLASGMNIPLAVGTLQKQIKQYITACSGVDVREVQVKVESTDRAAEDSPYAVSDEQAALPVEEPEPAPTPAEATEPVEIPYEEPETVSGEREQLTHQRLFSAAEEPNMVPEPPMPELPEEPAEEPVDENDGVESLTTAETQEAVAEAVIEEGEEPTDDDVDEPASEPWEQMPEEIAVAPALSEEATDDIVAAEAPDEEITPEE